MGKKDDKKPARWTCKFTVSFVPLPEEKEEAYWATIHYFAEVMFADLMFNYQKADMPICSECGTYLHLTEDGKHVCRNEICSLYNIPIKKTEAMNGKT